MCGYKEKGAAVTDTVQAWCTEDALVEPGTETRYQ